jgi:hypothetical protein
LQRALTLLLTLAWSLLALGASAQSHRSGAAPSRVLLEAFPLLGTNTPASTGWFTCTVRLNNPAAAQLEGSLKLFSTASYAGEENLTLTVAPFAVAGGSVVSVQLPTHGFGRVPPALQVQALDGQGQPLAVAEVAAPQSAAPFVFDLNVPSRIAPALRNAAVPVTLRRSIRGSYGAPLLAVSSPQINAATGEPVLPARAAGYSSATVVLTTSHQLARLTGAELTALTDWVLAGGSLAVVVTRPEDLRGAPLAALLGGSVQAAEAPAALKRTATFQVVPDPAAGGSPPSPDPGHPGSSVQLKRVSPSAAVVDRLVGYRGANLRDSPWGASASYGLGEIHLLAFDVTTEPEVGDEWVQLELLGLVQHSWDRKAHVALPHAELALDDSAVELVRRQLDPNQAARWAIAVAALLLLVYAVLAGPVNFYLAARSGRPLRALLRLPVWAAAALLLVVLLGVVAKGVSGRARRLTLVEAGAGMPRASAVRFRGFFASSAEQLTVRATERGSVLDVASQSDETQRWLVVDRDGARLEQFRAKPWQTVIVREDGFVALAGGVSILRSPHGQVAVKNRLARDLVAVVVKVPGEPQPRYFAHIADGQRVNVGDGELLQGGSAVLSGSGRGLGVDSFARRSSQDASGISGAWEAFESLADYETDWWPADVPVLLAQVAGGEGRLSDSGLQVDADRVLLRVIGYGGVL